MRLQTCYGEETKDDGEVSKDDDCLVAGLQRVMEHDPDDPQQGHYQVQLIPSRVQVAVRAATEIQFVLKPVLQIQNYFCWIRILPRIRTQLRSFSDPVIIF